MITVQHSNFADVFATLCVLMKHSSNEVQTQRWQGVEIKNRPGSKMRELLNVIVEAPVTADLAVLRQTVGPNLPWADDHFDERVSGQPLNPGEQWKNWPYALSADKFRDPRAIFNHTYMERLWPKYARRTDDGKLPLAGSDRLAIRSYPGGDRRPRVGLAWSYGDLEDLVDLLAKESDTRQAWIPLFFPEDTGVGDKGRKPCTLGYQVIVRDGQANMYYPLRSCDLRRHWRDDAYLAARLLLWIMERCRERAPEVWGSIVPGTLLMHHTSLHVFENDWRELTEGRSW